VAAAPHRVQQQNAIMKVFSANRVVKATTKSVLYILFSFFSGGWYIKKKSCDKVIPFVIF
jgi:hypothetical protein